MSKLEAQAEVETQENPGLGAASAETVDGIPAPGQGYEDVQVSSRKAFIVAMAALAGGGLILGQVMDYKFTTDALERRIDRLEAYIQARRDLEQAS